MARESRVSLARNVSPAPVCRCLWLWRLSGSPWPLAALGVAALRHYGCPAPATPATPPPPSWSRVQPSEPIHHKYIYAVALVLGAGIGSPVQAAKLFALDAGHCYAARRARQASKPLREEYLCSRDRRRFRGRKPCQKHQTPYKLQMHDGIAAHAHALVPLMSHADFVAAYTSMRNHPRCP